MNVQRVVVREHDCASFALPRVFFLSESVERNKKEENCKSHSLSLIKIPNEINYFTAAHKMFLVSSLKFLVSGIPGAHVEVAPTRN